MALTPKYKALTFSAEDETSLQKAVSEALESCVELNMGLRRCFAFPAENKEQFLCELATKETKGVFGKIADKVKGRIFVDHTVIHLMYIPVILNSTHAVAELKLKNMATSDELYSGTKVNLNEAFILTMTWPRSLFAEEVHKGQGLYLGGTITCSSSIKPGAKIGMWYPMWSEKVSRKQLYQETTDISNTKMIETFSRKLISSDAEMRSLMRGCASTDVAAKTREDLVSCSKRISLLDKANATGVDFTVRKLPEQLPSTSQTTVLKPKLVETIEDEVPVDKGSSEGNLLGA